MDYASDSGKSDSVSPERPKCFRPWTDQIALGIVEHENLRHATAACAACLSDLIDTMREGDSNSDAEDYGEYCSRMRLTFSFNGAVEDGDDDDDDLIRSWWEVAEVVFSTYARLPQIGHRELEDLLKDALSEPDPKADGVWLAKIHMAHACWNLDAVAGMMNYEE